MPGNYHVIWYITRILQRNTTNRIHVDHKRNLLGWFKQQELGYDSHLHTRKAKNRHLSTPEPVLKASSLEGAFLNPCLKDKENGVCGQCATEVIDTDT